MKLKVVFDYVDVSGKLTLEMAKKKAHRVRWKTKKGIHNYGTVMSVNKDAELVTIINDRGNVVQEALDMVERVK